MRRLSLLMLVLALLIAGSIIMVACAGKPSHLERYTCPMHPSVISDKPGDCPICGMRLVPLKEPGSSPNKGQTAPPAATIYTCPMHPSVTSDKPGDCPICGMKLVPRKAEAASGSDRPAKKTMYRSTMNPTEVSDKPGKDSMGMEMVPFEAEKPTSAGVPGLAPISIPLDRQKQMNLAFETVGLRDLKREIRTSARIVPDETRLFRITPKVEGYVEKLFINVTGQAVKKGQPLLSLYSPELVATEQEYLNALASARRLAGSPVPGVIQGGGHLVEAARRRLQLWDISDDQIDALAARGVIERALVLYSPATGVVSEKAILQGQKVGPGDSLMVIADLSTVWAEVDLYESDLPYVEVGMSATLTLPYWPDKTFAARVAFLDPFLDPASRTLKARLDLPNGGLLLKPEMYGNVTLALDLGPMLSVPDSAVMRTGQKTYAFRQRSDGSLEPVEIRVGARGGDFVEVLSGLEAGNRVVTSANFLVDSESSLKAALQAVAGK